MNDYITWKILPTTGQVHVHYYAVQEPSDEDPEELPRQHRKPERNRPDRSGTKTAKLFLPYLTGSAVMTAIWCIIFCWTALAVPIQQIGTTYLVANLSNSNVLSCWLKYLEFLLTLHQVVLGAFIFLSYHKAFIRLAKASVSYALKVY